jgi:lipoprotein-releasing system ATP-binding protein
MALIEVSGLSKRFQSGQEQLTVLSNLSFEIEEGTNTVITGESGSGKSTLLNIIGALDEPSTGSVTVAGRRIETLTEEQLTRYRSTVVGFVFQFHYLLPEFSARENVLMPALIKGARRADAMERADMLLAEVGLENRLGHYPIQLSGGERQRVAVARALMNEPRIVLADEPTGNLDEQNSARVRDLLFSLSRRHGTTLLAVSHDTSLAKAADIRYALERGGLKRL